jgi:hypothetical protein
MSTRKGETTGTVALANMGDITQNDKDVALEIAVQGLVADARRSSPIDRPGVLPPTSAPAPGGYGWRSEIPLSLPPGQDLIERMVNAALPPGPGHRRKPDDEPPKAA